MLPTVAQARDPNQEEARAGAAAEGPDEGDAPPDAPPEAPGKTDAARLLSLLLLVAVVYRVAYHAIYLGEVPFALGTFSDGAVYEQAALDVLERPPLGTRPFYLQGAYAYLLALGMMIRPWASLGLLVQIALAALTMVWVHRRSKLLWGPTAATYGTLVLLLHPGLLFYENKYLSAQMGISANLLIFVAFTGLLLGLSRESWRRIVGASVAMGAAVGLSVLARPNMILALPFALMAVVAALREHSRRRRAAAAGALILGAVLAVLPMAGRNLAVTGYPDIQPVHGGGTSFFIGNNPKSKGVWNDGDLLSARLGTESRELAAALDIDPALDERATARAIGAALYARAFTWIAEHPGDFAALEVHKLWLCVGNQQLSQDYDWLGERELIPWAHRVGVPFALLFALGIVGAGVIFVGEGDGPKKRRWVPSPTAPLYPRSVGARRGLAWLLAGLLLAPLAANLLFFTSAQHRLPLIVPAALLAGPGLAGLLAALRARRQGRHEARPSWGLLAFALVFAAQGAWPRSHRSQPSPVHYYNLAMVQDQIGDPRDALKSFDRAVELRPDEPIFRMRRAHLRLRLDDLDGAGEDIDFVLEAARVAEAEGHPLPAWITEQSRLDRMSVDFALEHPEARTSIGR